MRLHAGSQTLLRPYLPEDIEESLSQYPGQFNLDGQGSGRPVTIQLQELH